MHPGPGPLALVGSGEYLAVMAGVEGALIEGRPPRYVQIPTAAAPEGPQRLRYWLDLGAAQAERLGVEPVPVMVRDRDEAGSDDLAALIDGAGLIYLSGGNPQFLARTLRGTRVWAAAGAPPGTAVIGIDEDTAIVDLTGGGRSWQVHGRQQAWILAAGGEQDQDQGTGQPFPAGAIIKFDLYKQSLIFSGTCTRSMFSATRCAGGCSSCWPGAS